MYIYVLYCVLFIHLIWWDVSCNTYVNSLTSRLLAYTQLENQEQSVVEWRIGQKSKNRVCSGLRITNGLFGLMNHLNGST